ncbi:hypothetical protein ABID62_009812, partial [Bradyrhizobium sp. S3.9.1]
ENTPPTRSTRDPERSALDDRQSVVEFKKSAAHPSAAEDWSTVHPPCAVSDAI